MDNMVLYDFQIASQAIDDKLCNALVFCIVWIASQARNDGDTHRHCEDSERSEEDEAIQ